MVSSAVLLVGGGVIHIRTSNLQVNQATGIYYSALGLMFVLSLVIAGLLRSRPPWATSWLADAQVTSDIVVYALLVLATGGQDSVLTFLFPLNTLYSAALVSAAAGYTVAATGSASFALLVALQMTGVLPRLDEPGLPFDRDPITVVTATAGANLLVAMLAGQLSDQLRRSAETLQRTRVDLGELRTLHAAMVTSVASGLVSTNPEGVVQLLNPAAEKILGQDSNHCVGQPVTHLLHGASGAFEGSWMEAYHSPAGSVRHLAVTASALKDTKGNLRGTVFTFTDVTEQRMMEEAVAQSRQLATVGQFAAGLAHELRNPLGSMLGCVELLQSTSKEADNVRLLGIIHREAERLATLVTDFLSYARPSPSHLARVHLAPLLQEMAEDVARDSQLAAHVTVTCSSNLYVRADSSQLRQVMWNLLRNAAQAGPPGSPVEVLASRTFLGKRPAITLQVRDHGEGLPPQARQRLFEPFFTTRPKGTGLGLAMVHRIVEQHQGQVGVTDVLGPGACFYVTLLEHDGSFPPMTDEGASESAPKTLS